MRGDCRAPRTTIAVEAALLAGVLACPCAQVHAQEKPMPQARVTQEYHIEVNTLPGCFFSGCTRPVSAANIRVMAGRVRVPVRVAQPSGSGMGSAAVPVHLLVAFAPGIERTDDADLLAKLKPVLAAGWLVSVCRIDGSFTPYAHEAELRSELAGAGDTPRSDAGLDAIEGAIAELRAQPGYRVLLADLGGNSDDKFVRWLANTADRLSPIYVNDGGKAELPSMPSSTGGSDLFGRRANQKERAYTDGVFHELTLAEALRDALADLRYEYDVRFRAPAGAAADAPVKLTFLDPGTHLPFEIRTDLYTVETRDVDGKGNEVRADATGRLKTVEK
jgi:hypothetical protein